MYIIKKKISPLQKHGIGTFLFQITQNYLPPGVKETDAYKKNKLLTWKFLRTTITSVVEYMEVTVNLLDLC